jgi:hypothetical protein
MLVESDAWADGQIRSKLWLCHHLDGSLPLGTGDSGPFRVWLLGGWYAMTAFLLFTTHDRQYDVTSFDLDPECSPVARKVNNVWEIEGRFRTETVDVNAPGFITDAVARHGAPHIIINTSCEHMPNDWTREVPKKTLLAIQGTNMDHEQHTHGIRTLYDLVQYGGPWAEIRFANNRAFHYPDKTFERFMVIGFRE